MSLTVVNWPLIICLLGLLALVMFRQRPSSQRREPLPQEARVAQSGDDAPRLLPAPHDRALSPAVARVRDLRSPTPASDTVRVDLSRTLIVPAFVFLTMAGLGAATFYLRGGPSETGSEMSQALSEPDPEDEMLSHLADYTRSIETQSTPPAAGGDRLLPDVDTMVERLAARLKSAPDDIKGWQMLGWSYFHTGRYEEAATAYAKAMELDPSSAELRLSYGEARAKAASVNSRNPASPAQSEVAMNRADLQTTETPADPATESPRKLDAAIVSMVDGLANRLKEAPRDVEGWTRLMRSRVVLGDRERAVETFREALGIFKDDAAASGTIMAAAMELGLKDE